MPKRYPDFCPVCKKHDTLLTVDYAQRMCSTCLGRFSLSEVRSALKQYEALKEHDSSTVSP